MYSHRLAAVQVRSRVRDGPAQASRARPGRPGACRSSRWRPRPRAAQAATTGSISGSFTVPAGTVHPADVNIRLVDRNGNAAGNQGSLTVTNTSATTATYTITGVAPGPVLRVFQRRHRG